MKNIRQQLKHVVLLAALTLGCLPALAQGDILLNQQWFSRLNRNPAAAGFDKDNINLGLFYRSQWNIDDALNSGVLNVDSYIDAWKSNVGMSVSYDKPSPAQSSMVVNLAYAYRFNLTEKCQLSFGLAGGISNVTMDYDKLTTDVPDAGRPTGSESTTKADFNFGAELTTQKLTLGVSMTHFGSSGTGAIEEWRNTNQVYAYGRYMIPASSEIDLAPSVGYMRYEGGDQFEVGLTGFYQKHYWAGIGWRHDAAVVFMLGLDINMFSIGYAYDAAMGSSKKVGSGAHEILLRARIGKGAKKQVKKEANN